MYNRIDEMNLHDVQTDKQRTRTTDIDMHNTVVCSGGGAEGAEGAECGRGSRGRGLGLGFGAWLGSLVGWDLDLGSWILDLGALDCDWGSWFLVRSLCWMNGFVVGQLCRVVGWAVVCGWFGLLRLVSWIGG